MQELINFSVYDPDTARFDHDWAAIEAYTRSLNDIAGIELLIGYEPLPAAIPAGLVRGVHLPFWITWLDIWRGKPEAIARHYADVSPADLLYYCGGPMPVDMIEAQRRVWQHAAAVAPAYAVLHVSHVEIAHAFTRQFTYSSREVIDGMAELLNAAAATFPGGEPPVRLFLENLWWPGLTFTEPQQAEQLAERLAFDNWAFVLDTGHLMNTNPHLQSEDEGIDYVLQIMAALPPALRERIEGLHFHWSLSGAIQQRENAGLPANFNQLSMEEQRGLARLNAYKIDQHRPFTRPRCREIIDAVQPRFLTHEFLSGTQAEYEQKLSVQQATLSYPQQFQIQKI